LYAGRQPHQLIIIRLLGITRDGGGSTDRHFARIHRADHFRRPALDNGLGTFKRLRTGETRTLGGEVERSAFI
jgi:hypothetical protein